MYYVLLWLAIAVVAIGIDILTSSFLFVWFTVGGIFAIIASVLGATFQVQIIVFVAVSAVSMAIGYPLAKKTIKATVPPPPTMEKNYIGRIYTAEKDLVDRSKIKIDGVYWTIKTGSQNEIIKKGEKAEIVGTDGNKLVVKKLNK